MTNHTILLVEDNPDHALLALEALEAVHGATVDVRVASDGQQALDFLFRAEGFEDAATPNLILLDIQLPLVDGFEVLARVKADDRLRVIPTVMLTTSENERDILRSYGLGSNSYVTKPVDAEALFERIGQLPSYWFNVNALPPKERVTE